MSAQQEILDAIGRARVAARRMVLAQSLADDVGVQIAFQAVLHNLTVIGEAVKSIAPEQRERVPDFPWDEYAAVTDVIEPTYHQIAPAEIQRTLEAALEPLESAVERINPRR